MNLNGKKILITSYSLAAFGGAETNILELADQMHKFGAAVELFSYDIDGPLAKTIREKYNWKITTDNINVLAPEEDMGYTQLHIEDYDYVWVCANTVPISIIKQIDSAKKLPKFIFLHMSSLIGFPLDAPLMRDFEEKIAAKTLSISDEATSDNLRRVLRKDYPISYYRNPVPAEFGQLAKRAGTLKKAAVISSSAPPPEMLEVVELLKKQNIAVDCIGKFNNNVQFVDAKVFDKYDLIIGIGKDTQRSLVSGVPIYIYGRFGGCGYLDDSNYDTAKYYNFSGRGFGDKSKTIISKEIINGYNAALKFHNENRQKFIDEYSIDAVLGDLLTEIDKQSAPRVKFEKEYINLLVSMQILIMQWIQRNRAVLNLNERIATLEQELKNTNDEMQRLYNSKSWLITQPLRKLGRLAAKGKK